MIKARLRCVLLIFVLACAANAYGQGVSGRGLHRLSWPGKDWALDVSLPHFTVSLEDLFRDDLGYWLFAVRRADGKSQRHPLILRIRLEAAKTNGSSLEARDITAKKLNKTDGVRGVNTFEYKQFPTLRYALEYASRGYSPYPRPVGPAKRSIEAFLVKDDVWITFSIESLSLSKTEEQLFYAVLDSVKFTDISNPSSSFDYYYKAKSLILQKQYQQAAEHLRTALGLEQKQRQLDDQHWRKLIGHLLDVYASTGDKARAKELLDYGVSVDPTSPLFHLGLAQHYASLDDVENTIASLEKAYLYRQNDRQSIFWIDLMKHPSYERFRKNESFRRAAKRMK